MSPEQFYGVRLVELYQGGTKYQNAQANWRAAVRNVEVSDPFLYMNDDFFIMRPVRGILPKHTGTLLDHAEWYLNRGGKQYGTIMLRTHDYLLDSGIERPLSYELHIPMVVYKEPMMLALEAAMRVGPQRGRMLMDRSLYGNIARIGGRSSADVKVNAPGDKIPQGVFLSTSDASWLHNAGELVRRRFPRPGPYDPEDQHERRDALRAGYGGVVSFPGAAR
jgi:hypothetical protein